MLAMQYSFTLPADYDMAVIRQRIAVRGPLLDAFEGLHFKAYLTADRADQAPENLYAPFYLWRDAEAMQRFLGSPGFAAVTQAFGWPAVRCWPVWDAHLAPEARQAYFATREIAPIAPFTPLEELRRQEHQVLERDVGQGALAAVNAFDPTAWTLVRFRLWRDLPADDRPVYTVGHVSQPTPILSVTKEYA